MENKKLDYFDEHVRVSSENREKRRRKSIELAIRMFELIGRDYKDFNTQHVENDVLDTAKRFDSWIQGIGD